KLRGSAWTCRLRIVLPLEQGLRRHNYRTLYVRTKYTQNRTSTRTSIKTVPTQGRFRRLLLAQNRTSTRTRIKTLLSASFRLSSLSLRIVLPLEQGLRPRLKAPIDLFHNDSESY